MSSTLRNFRFQKAKPSTPTSSQGGGPASSDPDPADDLDASSSAPGTTTTTAVSDEGGGGGYEEDSSAIQPKNKRPRLQVLSDSDGENSPEKRAPKTPSFGPKTLGNASSNGYGFGGMPSPDVVQTRLDLLKHAFPDKDRMDLQDTLRECHWDTQKAIANLRESSSKSGPQQTSTLDMSNSAAAKSKIKKVGVKRHDAAAMGMSESESESDDEDQYRDTRVVHDSDDDEDEYSEDEGNGAGSRRQGGSSSANGSSGSFQMHRRMTEDQRRVFEFFNEGTVHELAGIQGCSRKKVDNIVELRPFISWHDLVSRVQQSRLLNTDLLNNAILLLKMRDAVAKLMDRCEKITNRMESLVENLIGSGGGSELAEQPGNIPDGLKLTGYQMIGLNWLILMHRQSLNGILADEMGLGKTIQAISFLAHLKDLGDEGPHLVIVPSSTMDNWQKEFSTWCPSIKVLNYYGSQDERRHMRLQIVQDLIEYDVILTTYNMVISSADDRVLFRKLDFHYVVFDEAHMLKNMATARYENLMRVQASRKLLLTGTPMQNNLVELMSLLVFVMPDMFANKKDHLKKMFSMFPKTQETDRSSYEKDRIAHAKRIMKPFFLRRLKADVLTDLPSKTSDVMKIPMVAAQRELYFGKVADYKRRAKELAESKVKRKTEGESGIGMLMNLRKIANHPLLVRNHYDDRKVSSLAKILKKDASHKDATEKFIVEDLSVMSDFDIHKTCLAYRCLRGHSLSEQFMCESGKFKMMDDLLPQMNDNGDRVLIFSQFTMVLDIMEQYLKVRGHRYLRLDGSTPVQDRQSLIDEFNENEGIFIFILSTRAGGLGINLTAANTVILHDLDFNPHNDKQAEDRCHRVGQTRPVRVIRLLSEETIEEGIYSIAQEKLKLEQDLSSEADEADNDAAAAKRAKKDVSRLLKIALDVDIEDDTVIMDDDVTKVLGDL